MKAYLIGDPDGDGKYEGFAQFDADNVHTQFLMAQTLQGLLPKTRKWRQRAS